MAKLSINRLIDASKYLATEAGEQLQEFITYVASFSEQIIRNLNNGLTIRDNFNAKVVTVELENATEQIVNTDNKIPTGVLVMRVISTTYRIDSFGWYLNGENRLVVTAGFTGSPSGKVNVSLAIFF